MISSHAPRFHHDMAHADAFFSAGRPSSNLVEFLEAAVQDRGFQ